MTHNTNAICKFVKPLMGWADETPTLSQENRKSHHNSGVPAGSDALDNTSNEGNQPIAEQNQGAYSDDWSIKLSLSQLLAIVAIPVGILGALYLFWQEEKTYVDVYVPAHELPAYYQIQASDLIQKPYAARSFPSGILKTSEEAVDRYTLAQLPKEKPLIDNQLGVKLNPTCFADAIAVSLPATPAMTFGGNMRAGDVVSITFSSPATKEGEAPSPTVFSDILVLDVKAVSQANISSTFVIVIALPRERQQEFATQLTRATALVSRSLSGGKKNCVM